MECYMEWNVICRICMQEGQMRSIFEEDDGTLIYEKIMSCSSVQIQRGMNLPEQICSSCLEELNVAFRFRSNCESSDAVLQSFLKGNQVDVVIPSDNGNVYTFVPPKGLAVKRIAKSPKLKDESIGPVDGHELDNDTESVEEDGVSIFDVKNEEHNEEYIIAECDENIDYDVTDNYSEIKKEVDSVEEFECENLNEIEFKESFQESENVNNMKSVTIRPVRSRKNVEKNQPVRIYAADSVHTKEDGTTVVRMRRNKNEPIPPKICEICGNRYKYKHALEAHMRRHRNEKPFACEICGRAFVLNVELRCHMRTHTGQKPYACRFCERKFSDYGSRIKHERTHTGERPYVCSTCGKSFAYSYGLSSHIMTHTGEKPFRCEVCGKRFTRKHHVKTHMNTHVKNKVKASKLERDTIVDNNSSEQVEYIDGSSSNMESMTGTTTEGGANEEQFMDMITVLMVEPKNEEELDDETKLDIIE